MTLFIPRKQNVTGAVGNSSEVDGRHMERALRENFLAIQRWANQQGMAAQVRLNSSPQIISGTSFNVATFDTVDFDTYKLASTTASTITIREPGVWLLCFGGQFTNLPANTHVDIQGLPGGAPPFFSQIADSADVILTSFANLTATGTRLISTNQVPVTAQVQVRTTVAPSTSTGFQLWEFSLYKLGDIPSAVQ
jgi:hypothetical protein